MKRLEFRTAGSVTKGGALAVPSQDELNEFLEQYAGRGMYVTLTPVIKPPSRAMRGYYYKGIIPTFQEALKNSGEYLTLNQTDEKLRSISPMMRKETPTEEGIEDEGFYSFNEVDTSRAQQYIEHLKRIGAELGVIVPEPRKPF